MKEIEIIRKEVGNQTVNNVDDILLDENLLTEQNNNKGIIEKTIVSIIFLEFLL